MAETAEAVSAWDRWNEATQSIAAGFETRPAGPVSAFRGSVRNFSVLGIDYTSLETNARSTSRGPDTVHHAGRHHCLVYQLRGRCMARQGNRVAVLGPSDMALLSPAEDCEIVNHGLIRQLSFFIPEQMLFDSTGSTDIPGAVAIAGDSALGSLLSTLIMQVHSRSGELSSFLTPALGSVMASLVTPLLMEERGEDASQAVDVESMVNVVTVSRYIDANLRNANLSPRYLARILGCSVRHLHRLFDGSGITVAAYIKQRRLAAIAQELRNPYHAEDSITEISLRWGFPEITHFSRSFRAEFGMSPREYRDWTRTRRLAS